MVSLGVVKFDFVILTLPEGKKLVHVLKNSKGFNYATRNADPEYPFAVQRFCNHYRWAHNPKIKNVYMFYYPLQPNKQFLFKFKKSRYWLLL